MFSTRLFGMISFLFGLVMVLFYPYFDWRTDGMDKAGIVIGFSFIALGLYLLKM